MRSSLNIKFIDGDLKWQLKISINQLSIRAGFGTGYLNQLIRDHPVDVKLSTVDAIWTAAMVRYAEIGVEPPDDLWERMVYHDPTDSA